VPELEEMIDDAGPFDPGVDLTVPGRTLVALKAER
jgi:hypothetical protein